MWPGLAARMTHDYTRHGTTSLFAALEVASGKVHGALLSASSPPRVHRLSQFARPPLREA